MGWVSTPPSKGDRAGGYDWWEEQFEAIAQRFWALPGYYFSSAGSRWFKGKRITRHQASHARGQASDFFREISYSDWATYQFERFTTGDTDLGKDPIRRNIFEVALGGGHTDYTDSYAKGGRYRANQQTELRALLSEYWICPLNSTNYQPAGWRGRNATEYPYWKETCAEALASITSGDWTPYMGCLGNTAIMWHKYTKPYSAHWGYDQGAQKQRISGRQGRTPNVVEGEETLTTIDCDRAWIYASLENVCRDYPQDGGETTLGRDVDLRWNYGVGAPDAGYDNLVGYGSTFVTNTIQSTEGPYTISAGQATRLCRADVALSVGTDYWWVLSENGSTDEPADSGLCSGWNPSGDDHHYAIEQNYFWFRYDLSVDFVYARYEFTTA